MYSWIRTLSKITFLLLILVITSFVVLDVMVEEGPRLSTISLNGYKDLSEEDSIYIIFQDTRVKWGGVLIPDNFERKISLQVTFPGLFSEGMRRFTVNAEDGDLIVSSIETRPLNLDP